MLEPALQHRCSAFLANAESATLRDILNHLEHVQSEFEAGDADDPSDDRWIAIMAYLQAVPTDVDASERLRQDIDAVEALIAEHGDRRLK